MDGGKLTIRSVIMSTIVVLIALAIITRVAPLRQLAGI